jgi:ribosomal biogenesis protein LAS1
MQAITSSETAAEPPPSPAIPKKKKKKRKKTSDTTDQTIDANCSSNKLSLKKRLFLKKSAKQTPWYDINELISTGRDLLLALKLFPSPHSPNHATFESSDIGTAIADAPLGLTSDEYCQLKSALSRVALWRGRSDRGGRLPHAIDVTAGLAGVLLMDAERSRDSSIVNNLSKMSTLAHQPLQSSSVSLYQLRNSYSTLLLRSVNGLADTYRHQKKSALLSVAHCCSLAGLPLWIVDVRHDASHNDLPSLGVCRIGALESLKFWKGRYWDTLDETVSGDDQSFSDSPKREGPNGTLNNVSRLTMDCLIRYQMAVESEAVDRVKVLQNKKYKPEKNGNQRLSIWRQFSRRKDNLQMLLGNIQAAGDECDVMMSSEENDVKLERDESCKKEQKPEDTNPWWILEDTKPKKKKAKKLPESRDENDKNVASDANTSVNAVDGSNVISTSNPSSRECAAELIRTAPIEVLYSTTLQFLVWGRMNDTEVKGPALLSLTDKNNEFDPQLSIEDLFEELRVSYEPLVVSIISTYPGFLAALFVHIVDSIICLDSERNRLQNESNYDDAKNLYNEWNLQCLVMWTCFILTREFHMHLDRSVAVIESTIDKRTNQKISDPVDLKKKGRRKWTCWEQVHMQNPPTYHFLRGCGLPLNSAYDRLLHHLSGLGRKVDEQSTDIVTGLLLFLKQIIEEPNVAESKHSSEGVCKNGSDITRLKPWTLCKSWDACAIGAMPGYPA